MRKRILLLAVLPMLVWAEQPQGGTRDSNTTGKADATVAESVGSPEKLSAYRRAGDWRHFADLIEATIKTYPPKYGEHNFADAVGVGIGGDRWALNIIAWDVFNHCDEKAVLT